MINRTQANSRGFSAFFNMILYHKPDLKASYLRQLILWMVWTVNLIGRLKVNSIKMPRALWKSHKFCRTHMRVELKGFTYKRTHSLQQQQKTYFFEPSSEVQCLEHYCQFLVSGLDCENMQLQPSWTSGDVLVSSINQLDQTSAAVPPIPMIWPNSTSTNYTSELQYIGSTSGFIECPEEQCILFHAWGRHV